MYAHAYDNIDQNIIEKDLYNLINFFLLYVDKSKIIYRKRTICYVNYIKLILHHKKKGKKEKDFKN